MIVKNYIIIPKMIKGASLSFYLILAASQIRDYIGLTNNIVSSGK
jgi:hypothetical protein